MSRVRKRLVFLGLLAVAAGLAAASALTPGELRVPQEYQTIQEAIDAARPGETILVAPGTYVENLKITKRELTVRGTDPDAGKVVIQAKFGDEPVVLVRERDVRLSNLTLTGGLRGIEIESRADNPALFNLIVRDNSRDGLFLEEIRGGELSGSRVEGNGAAGVYLSSRAVFRLEGNRIVGNRTGVEALDATLELRENLIKGNVQCGLKVDQPTEVAGTDNAIYGNGQDLCGAAQGREDLLDRTPPPAPLNLTLTPAERTNGPISVDWEEPEDPAEIVAYWFKVGSPPTGPEDGTRREIAQKPLIVENPPEGEQPLFLWLEDGMGNKSHENAARGTIKFDKTPPEILPTIDPEPNEHGWNNGEVTVRFQCEDELSGVESCTPAEPVHLTEEGKDQVVRAEAVDKAGNHAEVEVRVNIDKTPPVIQAGEPQGELGKEGWCRSDVKVPYTAQDNLSGFADGKLTIQGEASTSGEGADRMVLIRVSDLADNSAELTLGPFKVDKTPPSLRIVRDPSSPNGRNGWYTKPVKVTYECRDALSGLDPETPCPPATTLTEDGIHRLSLGPIRDLAGNIAERMTAEVRIDKTPPEVRCKVPDATRWYREDVTVRCTASDATSGLANPGDASFTLVARGEGTNVSTGRRSIADRAGNTATAGPYTFKIDKTPPTIEAQPSRPPDANGWYNREVTVHFKCDDRLSDIAGCTPPVTVSREGRDQTIRGEAVDRAGNRATTAIRISLDRTPPTGSLTINEGAEKTCSLTVTLSIEARDNLSGPAEMRFSNDGRTWSEWEPFRETRRNWDLSAYGGSEERGTKTVWAQVKDKAGNISKPFSDGISYPLWHTIRVPKDCSSLRKAIAAASEGASILIGPGTYEGNLVIRKSLTLRGAGSEKTIIKGNWGTVIRIESEEEIEVLIENLTIAEAKGTYADGIQIAGKATVTIRNSRISGNDDDGISMWGSSRAAISGSEISGNDEEGISMGGSSRAIISGSVISGNGDDGIWMRTSSRATISGSVISRNRYGILIWDSSQATVRDNVIFENEGYGVALSLSPRCEYPGRFDGKVEGSGNMIYGNEEGDVCPSELRFLMTRWGGCYGPKCD